MTDRGGTTPAESLNLRLVGHSDMNGHGVTMQLIARSDSLYVAHFQWPVGFSVVDVSDPRFPRVVKQVPALPLSERNLLMVSEEANAADCMEHPRYVRVIDIKDEQNPRILSRRGKWPITFQCRPPPRRRFRPTRYSWIPRD